MHKTEFSKNKAIKLTSIIRWLLLIGLIYTLSMYIALIYGTMLSEAKSSWYYEGLYIPSSVFLLIYLWINHIIRKIYRIKISIDAFDKLAVMIYLTIMTSFTIVSINTN